MKGLPLIETLWRMRVTLCITGVLLLLPAGGCKKKPPPTEAADSSRVAPRVVYLPSFESAEDKPQALHSILAMDRLKMLVVPLPEVQPPEIDYWSLGERALASGQYRQAAEAYEAVLRRQRNPEIIDAVLFRLALVYSMPDSPLRSEGKAGELLSRILREFPDSDLAVASKLILKLQREVERLRAQSSSQADKITELSTELEKLKELDLKRRRRPPR